MKTYTPQETFDIVARHLLRQSKKSFLTAEDYDGIDKLCAYRGVDGLRCAAGCLIPDDLYGSHFEDETVRSVAMSEGMKDFFGHDIKLVTELQACHDSLDVRDWLAQLHGIANLMGIDGRLLSCFEWSERDKRYVEKLK